MHLLHMISDMLLISEPGRTPQILWDPHSWLLQKVEQTFGDAAFNNYASKFMEWPVGGFKEDRKH